ncbi:uncharacterized protein LY89DRAFT_738577 [Mollisia scopiformis]|uniref:Pleckstrin homology domain-containing protein n=1 Tax=Mollisia scopiformis TaxID=149040 RepID=A0A194WVE8_MOLSC|nr:uncharacterized protein LY89DRAFT_738577 [Mollisia scopiformis]KUJ11943.1 hypothetical protein LY89DRAFT_738577 [Mollisia scopiformis]
MDPVTAANMKEWETEDEYAAAAAASLPTPTDTPYRTPSRGSRRSSRQKSISPGPSSSPPPLPPGEKGRRDSRDVTNDESISILDPRRFTPTLHANLVSEILALRRDQEEKTKTIESLESELHETRGEHEEIQTTLVSTSKENRSLKRQLALLEGGTSSALSELARERDEAIDTHNETRKRLEVAQKKIRSQEEDSDRVHELWSNDKDNWEEEKRKLERKVHIAESRLRTVLDEVATYQADQQNGHTEHENELEEASRDTANGHASDAASVRTMSMTNSIRFSILNGTNGYGGTKLNGMSLADELDLDEDEDQTDYDGRESVLSVRHKRNQSRESVMSKNHRRNQSIESLMRPGSVARGRLLAQQAVLDRLEDGIMEDDENAPPPKVEYVDTGVQFSPPPSPKLQPVEVVQVVEPIPVNGVNGSPKIERHEPAHREWEIEANQRRKRVHASPPLVIEPPASSSMVSSASQTIEDPLSPPRTPISPTRAPPPPPSEEKLREMTSISTQTDAPEPALQSPKRAAPPPPIPIPSIQLHPPNSAPATPHEPLLPQHFKDAGCQVSMQVPVPTRSISVQTEEIRVAQRINLLPPHLQPSAISSKPPSPEPILEENKRFSPVPGNLPPRNPRRVTSRTSLDQQIPSSPPELPSEPRDAYPGNNDDGPVSKDRTFIRRPHRISSLFAGFDNASSDDADDFADADMSDNDFRTALSAPKPHNGLPKISRRVSSGPTSVPENVELSEVSRPYPSKGSMRQVAHQDANGDYSLPEVQALPSRAGKTTVRQLDKPLTLVTNNKPNTMRRAALIQSGVAAHQGRARSPSLPEPVKEPPFPIPTRASSRRPPISASAPSDGNRSPTYGRGGGGRGHYRANSIRKVRSAAALPRGGRAYRRHGSRSPPPMSASTEAPESPQLPPMPNNEITTPRYMRETGSSRYRSHTRQQPSTNTANTSNTANTGNGSVGTNNQATSVVDAIAQTMVGEWMFKYVRRRKSFGVSESNGMEGDNANGVRHKRWVWLAPYERAVMWSSKQPTSGSALMGKTGRKLTIQSVLDVKDENPPPKGSAPLFNRSILILTPARALKFTAVSAERHYVWLTALSFLAHSSQAVPEIVQAPLPIPTIPDFEIPRQANRLRKGGIRDSIRVAKGKTTSARQGPTSVHSSQQDSIREAESIYSGRTDGLPDIAADPPIVPRFTDRGRDNYGPPLTHGRKRSNTGSRVPPPLSFRGFSGPSSSGHAPTSSTAGLSVGTTGSSDIYNQSQPSSSIAGGGFNVSSGRSSIRTSDASGRPGAVVNNFFDAVGTMRMEAFISPMALSRFDDYPDEQDEMDFVGMHRRRSKERRRRERESFYGSSRGSRPSEDYYGGSKTAGEEEYGRFDEAAGYDPFRGF